MSIGCSPKDSRPMSNDSMTNSEILRMSSTCQEQCQGQIQRILRKLLNFKTSYNSKKACMIMRHLNLDKRWKNLRIKSDSLQIWSFRSIVYNQRRNPNKSKHRNSLLRSMRKIKILITCESN